MLMDDVKEVLISQDEITQRCEELGEEISRDYKYTVPIIVGLLKGSVPFMAELIKYITIDVELEFMAVPVIPALSQWAMCEFLKTWTVRSRTEMFWSLKILSIPVIPY